MPLFCRTRLAIICTQRVVDVLNGELDKGVPNDQVVKVLDAGKEVVSDTQPDDSGELLNYMNLVAGDTAGACGALGTVSVQLKNGLSVTYSPERNLVMSYFKGCVNFGQLFSLKQAERMRNALINGNRRHLIAVQLGDTAYTGDVVCATWNPNPNAQFYCWGYALDDFKAKYNEMMTKRMRLASQQAYVRNGAILFDGIWNPGSQPQEFILGWTAEDFRNKYGEMWDKQFKLLLIDAHLVDGGLRYDAVWNPDSGPQFVVWGMTREQVRQYYDEMWQMGMKFTSMNTVRI